MTRISLSIEMQESVDPAALGRWLEGWIRDRWDEYQPYGVRDALHLESVEAKPPASGRRDSERVRTYERY